MYPRILSRFRQYIRTRQYVMTLHAEEEMADDELSILDVERAILTGDIVERQRDHKTGEWKYLVRGETTTGSKIMVVIKLGATDKLVMITLFPE